MNTPPLRPPAQGRFGPFDPRFRWVKSSEEEAMHLAHGQECRWRELIFTAHREYTNATPDEGKMCVYCRREWRRTEGFDPPRRR